MFRCTSLNPLAVLTPLVMSSHILFSTKVERNAGHFMVVPILFFLSLPAALLLAFSATRPGSSAISEAILGTMKMSKSCVSTSSFG